MAGDDIDLLMLDGQLLEVAHPVEIREDVEQRVTIWIVVQILEAEPLSGMSLWVEVDDKNIMAALV
ncbi:hypothetical protein C473_02058 [Halorubrum distributum JCM 10247]|uniref:Uncharacterized protein n=1 Tax=Halorubrum distributum JCM 10247 TaxID=1227486 RepID=M0DLQ5_9EURY|nr:hypothetical protein C473_02058 [Halorubrum terrestre JCM 10247]